jgi:hypothetical protein
MTLILKRASISRLDGQWSDNDFDVLADGKVVGRIYEPRDSRFGPPELRWETNGTAATREEARPLDI